MKKILFLTFVSLLIFSCGEKKKFLPNSVGKINSMAVVIDTDLWKSAVGDTLRKYFASPIDGIPGQAEPLFSVSPIPEEIFQGNTRNSRNILIISTKKEEKFFIKDTLFAKPQKVAYLSAKTTDDLLKNIQKNASHIIGTFKKNEYAEAQNRFLKSPAKITEIEQIFGIKMQLPSIYQLKKQDEKFLWIERKVKGGTANILIHELSISEIYTNEKQSIDETFLDLRDSVGKKFVPGREEGMYMVTQREFPPTLEVARLGNRTFWRSQGLWEMKNFMLGGPFINYTIFDEANQKVLFLDGFILAPGEAKRDYLFEMEAIFRTIQFSSGEKPFLNL